MSAELAEITILLSEIKAHLMKKVGVTHIRVNVMSPKSSKLQMIAHTEGFGAEETKISLSKGQGCSGKAWNTKAMAIADLAKDVQWISDDDQRRVKAGLAVIVALPIFDPEMPALKKVIGTLTIDSVERILDPLKGAVPDVQAYADKIAALMKKGNL